MTNAHIASRIASILSTSTTQPIIVKGNSIFVPDEFYIEINNDSLIRLHGNQEVRNIVADLFKF